MTVKTLSAQVGARERAVAVEALEDGRFRVVLDGVERRVDARRLEDGAWSLLVDGVAWIVDVDPGKDGALACEVRGRAVTVKLSDPRLRRIAEAVKGVRLPAGPEALRAPMPGKVVKLLCRAGDAVAAGQGLVVVEAMKMENELKAPRAAAVKAVHVAEGQAVEAQEALVTLE